MFRRLSIAVAVAATVALAGCSTMTEIRADTRAENTRVTERADALLAQRPAASATAATGAIITDLPYVDPRPVLHESRLPASFRRQVTMNEPMGLPMGVLVQRVQAIAGVRVGYQPELFGAGVASAPAAPVGRGTAGGMDATLGGGLAAVAGLPPLSASATSSMSRQAVPITYSGDVKGLLDAIAGATGSAWDYDPGQQQVTFYRYKVESFRLPTVQGEMTAGASMGGQQQSGSGDSGTPISQASAEGKLTASASVWADMEATVKSMLSPEGAVVVNQSLGTLTVRDRADRMADVRRFVQDSIAALSRQVDIAVTIYRVTVSNTDTRALNWNALFQATAGKYGISLDTTGSRYGDPNATSLTLSIPTSNTKWGGSQLIMDALSTLGNTTVEQNTTIVASNNSPAPLKVVRRTSYLKSLAQGVVSAGTGTVATGPTLTPGVVETGLNLLVIPHVMDDGKRVRLRLMGSVSTLEKLNTIGTATSFIQVPETSSREVQSDVWLTSGDTFVIAGLQQTDAGLDTRSPLDKSIWMLGGASQARNVRETYVIAIRPVVQSVRSQI